MSKRKLEQPEPLAERFSVRRFGGRAHQVAMQDRKSFFDKIGGEGGSNGPCRVLVQNFKPLTPEGSRRLTGGESKSPKFLRGF